LVQAKPGAQRWPHLPQFSTSLLKSWGGSKQVADSGAAQAGVRVEIKGAEVAGSDGV
jgi:hypothetical protein